MGDLGEYVKKCRQDRREERIAGNRAPNNSTEPEPLTSEQQARVTEYWEARSKYRNVRRKR